MLLRIDKSFYNTKNYKIIIYLNQFDNNQCGKEC